MNRIDQIRERRNALPLRHGDWPCQTVHNAAERAFQQYILEDIDLLLSEIDKLRSEFQVAAIHRHVLEPDHRSDWAECDFASCGKAKEMLDQHETTARFVTAEEAERTSANSSAGVCRKCGGTIPTCCKCVYEATAAETDPASFNEYLREQLKDPEFAKAYAEVSAEVDAEFARATGSDRGAERMPTLPFICDACHVQQFAAGRCANCGRQRLRCQFNRRHSDRCAFADGHAGNCHPAAPPSPVAKAEEPPIDYARLANAYFIAYDLAGIDREPLPERLPESAYVPGYMDKVRELREVFNYVRAWTLWKLKEPPKYDEDEGRAGSPHETEDD